MQTILLLHGALGSAGQLTPLAEALGNTYDVHRLNFSGHGGNAMPERPFDMEMFAEDVLRYMETHGLERAAVFGYSMGGYVGMYLAKRYPEKISRLITLATKFHWDEATAVKEIKMLDPEQTAAKVPAFAEALQARHAPNDWKGLMLGTADMIRRLGENNALRPEDYPLITTPCLLLLGDRDKMITLEETVQTYQLLPDARMGILPATGHPVEKLNLQVAKCMVDNFLL